MASLQTPEKILKSLMGIFNKSDSIMCGVSMSWKVPDAKTSN